MILSRLKRWWQLRTGQTDTPFDGESPYWVVSLIVHLVVLIVLAKSIIPQKEKVKEHQLVSELEELVEIVEPEQIIVPQEFTISDERTEEVGANSDVGAQSEISFAPVLADISQMPTPDIPEAKLHEFHIDVMADIATGSQFSNITVKGSVGESTNGASGAIDRLTQEILNHLEERPTTVVWIFDQSASLLRQRAEILERIDRVYEELSVIQSTGNEKFSKHNDEPLLTSVVAFGQSVSKQLKKPTNNLADIKQAIANIERDDTGVERVFTAIYSAAKEFQGDRQINRSTGAPKRDVMLIVVSDEAGDDIDGLDETVMFCRKLEIPVYVIGVPAPFGRKETPVKWVDPDPNYDQTPQWSIINQGPESLAPERIQLHFSGANEDEAPIDSGFGPFALTRICYETGGIYFAVHPNREVSRRIARGETDAYAGYYSYFFKPDVMRRYRPDYVSAKRYWEDVTYSKTRTALVQTAQRSSVSQMAEPKLRFEKLDEASFVRDVTLAQQLAASLEPQINQLYESLRIGEADRDKETTPRWQAGFDLAMGRVLAVKVRTEAYNSMLAQSKTGLSFKDKKSNVWELKPSDAVTTGGQAKKMAEKAEMYLQRVITEHPDTPWALLAQRELETPLGWEWVEDYQAPPAPPTPRTVPVPDVPPPPNLNRPDDRPVMLAPPKERRPPPKL
jgi:hypothetical protein